MKVINLFDKDSSFQFIAYFHFVSWQLYRYKMVYCIFAEVSFYGMKDNKIIAKLHKGVREMIYVDNEIVVQRDKQK